ncbi:DUF5786 family protein [Halonotius aquaticus]|mgnify:FL=1|jgi:hypothetical protein|uniref:DUF5786 family protein n=1 Tax=Halonotius aquaticus TaxID=2216978 RepID=UPI0014031C8A|nr:DUF5786 family protein [Halonotius aquaticus]
MSLGDYDEAEHERRERKNATVDADFEQARSEYEGSMEYDTGESADELLAQFEQLQTE